MNIYKYYQKYTFNRKILTVFRLYIYYNKRIQKNLGVTIMKKTLLTTALISGAVLGLGAMNSVSAADTVTSKDTTASATFTAGGGTGPDAGPLSITSATPSIDFGSNEISATKVSYPAKNNGINVTVSDLRGNFSGWNVTVSGTPLASKDTPDPLAASLTLPDGVAKTDGAVVDKVTAASVADILSGSSVAISAANGSGTGVVTTDYDKGGILLNVMGGKAHATSYTTTLTWSLTDGPKA